VYIAKNTQTDDYSTNYMGNFHLMNDCFHITYLQIFLSYLIAYYKYDNELSNICICHL